MLDRLVIACVLQRIFPSHIISFSVVLFLRLSYTDCMEKRYRLALMLLAIVCIFNILTGFLLLFKNQKLESTRRVYSSNVFENSSVDNDEVLSAQTSNSVLDERRVHNLDSLRFCYNDICKEVPFPVFDSWIIDGKLDRDVTYFTILPLMISLWLY